MIICAFVNEHKHNKVPSGRKRGDEQLTMCAPISVPNLREPPLVAASDHIHSGVKQLQISEVFSDTDLISQRPHERRLSVDV